MADEDVPHANGNGHEENGHVPEIELIIKVSFRLVFTDIVHQFLYFYSKVGKLLRMYLLTKLSPVAFTCVLSSDCFERI